MTFLHKKLIMFITTATVLFMTLSVVSAGAGEVALFPAKPIATGVQNLYEGQKVYSLLPRDRSELFYIHQIFPGGQIQICMYNYMNFPAHRCRVLTPGELRMNYTVEVKELGGLHKYDRIFNPLAQEEAYVGIIFANGIVWTSPYWQSFDFRTGYIIPAGPNNQPQALLVKTAADILADLRKQKLWPRFKSFCARFVGGTAK